MEKKKLTTKQKIEVCEVIAFLGLMTMMTAGFCGWIFGSPVDPITKPLAVIGLAAFLLGAWKGGCFR